MKRARHTRVRTKTIVLLHVGLFQRRFAITLRRWRDDVICQVGGNNQIEFGKNRVAPFHFRHIFLTDW